MQTVTEHMEKKKVDAHAKKLSGASGGNTQYLGQYSKALSQIIAELLDEKTAKYTQLAEDWNRKEALESPKESQFFPTFWSDRLIQIHWQERRETSGKGDKEFHQDA